MNRTRLLALLLAAMMTVPAQMTAAAAQPQTAVQTGSVAVTQEDKSVETSLSSLENTTVGTTTEFTVTTRGETDLGTTVYGCFTVNSSEPNLGSDGDMTIEYYETAELGQGWHELPSNYFGPEEGFPFNALGNPMESRFKVTFHKPGSYEIVVLIKEKDGDEVVCQTASFTVNVTEEEPEEPSRFELWLDRHLGSEKAASFFITVAVVLGIVFSVGLFILLPTALTGLVGLAVPLPMWLRNLLEGVVRIVIFMGYLMLCSHMKDIRRVFQYHGAEHKTIFCYEHGLPLTVENVRIQPRHHPRCGTSFLFVVIVVSILLSSVLFSFVEVTNTFARMGLHLLLLPVIVSLTYELNRVVGRYDNRLTRLVSAPGMWLQNWTTFEPDDSMIEVGIRAFTLVLPEEKGKDQW